MLLKNPAEFEHKAREWAVKYAGAQRKEIGEGSGGATPETIKQRKQQTKESESKSKLVQ
jgi:ubiquitin-conjugating enzyme (huntingtin interacting protein 2)